VEHDTDRETDGRTPGSSRRSRANGSKASRNVVECAERET
jgi:hypothetical protein